MEKRLKLHLADVAMDSSLIDTQPGKNLLDVSEGITLTQDINGGFLVVRIPLFCVEILPVQKG